MQALLGGTDKQLFGVVHNIIMDYKLMKASCLSLAVVATNRVFDDLPTCVKVVLFVRGAFLDHLQDSVDELLGFSGLVELDESLLIAPATHQF